LLTGGIFTITSLDAYAALLRTAYFSRAHSLPCTVCGERYSVVVAYLLALRVLLLSVFFSKWMVISIFLRGMVTSWSMILCISSTCRDISLLLVYDDVTISWPGFFPSRMLTGVDFVAGRYAPPLFW
jgi:hypothetical protein